MDKTRIAIGVSSFAAPNREPLKVLESFGAVIVPNPYGRRLDENEIIAHLDNIDGLIAGLEPLNRKVLTSTKKLKAIARVGIGISNIDLQAAEELGIKVSNTPDGPTEAVSEMTVAALLSLGRQLIPSSSALHQGQWKKIIGFGLRDLKILLIGYGRIGQKTGQILKALGAKILIYDPFIKENILDENGQFVSLPEGLSQADVISLHASGDKTVLGANEFDLMKDGVVLLNSARGELVDEESLIHALDSGKVKNAWFDAFWQEPYSGRLTAYEQVILTPHIATYTEQCRYSMEMSAAHNLLRDLGIS